MAGQVKQLSEHETFADRLRTAMIRQSIGLGRLAQATGITQRQLVNYRQGRHTPRDAFGAPTANAHKLAEELEVDVDWLVPPDDSAPAAA